MDRHAIRRESLRRLFHCIIGRVAGGSFRRSRMRQTARAQRTCDSPWHCKQRLAPRWTKGTRFFHGANCAHHYTVPLACCRCRRVPNSMEQSHLVTWSRAQQGISLHGRLAGSEFRYRVDWIRAWVCVHGFGTFYLAGNKKTKGNFPCDGNVGANVFHLSEVHRC